MIALGATSAVLTAKHGCGFLAWEPTATLPDGSPYTYHVPSDKPLARLFVEAMTARGLGYGFYYSVRVPNEVQHRGFVCLCVAVCYSGNIELVSPLVNPAADKQLLPECGVAQRATTFNVAAWSGSGDAGAVRSHRSGARQGAVDAVRQPDGGVA